MFRINVQIASAASITAGEGKPGGTSGVLFIDAADGNKLKLVMPDGTVRTSEKKDGSTAISFATA